MLRVFVGIPVDTRARQLIDELLEPLKNPGFNIRWVPGSNLHMTLAFLGNIEAAMLENLRNRFDETYQDQPRFLFQLPSLTRFPNRAGRIVALCGKPNNILDCLYQLTQGLLEANGFVPDRRAFRPHITLGKFQKARQVKTSFDQSTDITLSVSCVRLYQSTFTSTGMRYTALKETRLKI
jgi:2'-5' RNA ligase